MAFELPPLPYAPEALEPHIDATTMQLHHAKHHQAYLDKLNKAIEGTDLAARSIEDILKNVSNYSVVVRNNGGGYYNHNLFWPMLTPNGGGEPTGAIADAINQKFQGFAQFKEAFAQAALEQFGSGWAWLCKDITGELLICSTANQDNPIMDVVEEGSRGIPVLGLDVWEHGYYLKYQNRRAEYIDAFWNIVNWEEVNKRFQAPMP
ncbi:MAG: superoxide dismutase [Candidatus Amoebophilus sp.]